MNPTVLRQNRNHTLRSGWKHCVFPLHCLGWIVPGSFLGCGDFGIEYIPQETGRLGVSLGRVAVVTSDVDRVEELLTRLELPYTLYDGFVVGPPDDAPLLDEYSELPPVEALLSNRDTLLQYDVLFLNCGIRGSGVIDPATLKLEDGLLTDDNVLENLAFFVESGGRLVVSDQSYTVLEAALPQLIDFYGSDLEPGAAEVGQIETLESTVVDAPLATSLETDSVTLNFPLSGWVVPSAAEGVWVTGDVLIVEEDGSARRTEGSPLLIQRSLGYGLVTFMSFHNLPADDQVGSDLQLYLLRSLAREDE